MTCTSNLLGCLATLIHDATLQKMGAAGISCESDLAALNVLHHHPGMRIETLRKILRISHSACVRVAERLLARNLVTKGPTEDGRAVLLSLAPAGADFVQMLIPARQNVLENAIFGLSEADIQALERICAHILKACVEDATAAKIACRFCDESRCNPCPIDHGGQTFCVKPVVP